MKRNNAKRGGNPLFLQPDAENRQSPEKAVYFLFKLFLAVRMLTSMVSE